MNKNHQKFIDNGYSYGAIKKIGKVGNVKIGRFCSIASSVSCIFSGHDTQDISTYRFDNELLSMNVFGVLPSKMKTPYGQKQYGDLIIGDNVWIGHGVTFIGGVKVGSGSIIGALSVVRKDIEPYTINYGNPCRISKCKFTIEQTQKLLQIAWWDWPIEKIKENVDLLLSGDVDRFIEVHCK